MTEPLLDRLVGRALDAMVKRLTSKFRCGGTASRPEYMQPIVDSGRKYFSEPVDDEKAVEAVARVLVSHMAAAVSTLAVGYALFHDAHLEMPKFLREFGNKEGKAKNDEKP